MGDLTGPASSFIAAIGIGIAAIFILSITLFHFDEKKEKEKIKKEQSKRIEFVIDSVLKSKK